MAENGCFNKQMSLWFPDDIMSTALMLLCKYMARDLLTDALRWENGYTG
jgi:hypothetical protein